MPLLKYKFGTYSSTVDTNDSEFGDLRSGRSHGNALKSMLSLDYIVICEGESGWRLRNKEQTGSLHVRETPLLLADDQGKAQGVSIERGMRIEDVLGRLIVMRMVESVSAEEEATAGTTIKKQSPALGVIGCQCMKRNR